MTELLANRKALPLMASITTAISAWLLLIFLPLAGRASMPKMLCLVTSLLTLLVSVEPGRAVFPWGVGMILALVSPWERFRPI
jgi:hypothetical protein